MKSLVEQVNTLLQKKLLLPRKETPGPDMPHCLFQSPPYIATLLSNGLVGENAVVECRPLSDRQGATLIMQNCQRQQRVSSQVLRFNMPRRECSKL